MYKMGNVYNIAQHNYDTFLCPELLSLSLNGFVSPFSLITKGCFILVSYWTVPDLFLFLPCVCRACVACCSTHGCRIWTLCGWSCSTPCATRSTATAFCPPWWTTCNARASRSDTARWRLFTHTAHSVMYARDASTRAHKQKARCRLRSIKAYAFSHNICTHMRPSHKQKTEKHLHVE